MVDQTRRVVEDFVFCLFRGDKMTPILYSLPPSAPCRAVRLLARMIGIELDLKTVNILKGEHKTEEFLEVNPQHTIPTLDDHGLVLWESRAIMTYLVAAYAKDDTLYPADIRVRAMIDQRLQFDLGTLYLRMGQYYFPTMFRGAPLDPSLKTPLDEAVSFLESDLLKRKWAATNHFTVADVALAVTVSNLEVFGYDLEQFPKVYGWFERCKSMLEPFGYEEINQTGANILASMLKANLEKL